MGSTDRRGFLRSALVGTAAAGLAGGAGAAEPAAPAAGQVDRRPLGKTGAQAGIYGLGLGSAFTGAFANDPEGADAILSRAIDVHGINYWDTAASYTSKDKAGKVVSSMALIGRTLPRVRDKVFMVSKTDQRTYDGYKRDVERSLKALNTDHLDLMHCHDLRPDLKLDVCETGCVKAARELKEQGVIKHWGCTGHTNAAILMEFIKRFDPECVMTTFPAGRPDNGKYEDQLLPLAVERKMGVIAMKTVRQARAADIKGTDLVRYALSLKGICVAIVGCDTVAHLDDNARMATNFTPLTRAEKLAMNDHVQLVLGDETPRWLTPGYYDGKIV